MLAQGWKPSNVVSPSASGLIILRHLTDVSCARIPFLCSPICGRCHGTPTRTTSTRPLQTAPTRPTSLADLLGICSLLRQGRPSALLRRHHRARRARILPLLPVPRPGLRRQPHAPRKPLRPATPKRPSSVRADIISHRPSCRRQSTARPNSPTTASRARSSTRSPIQIGALPLGPSRICCRIQRRSSTASAQEGSLHIAGRKAACTATSQAYGAFPRGGRACSGGSRRTRGSCTFRSYSNSLSASSSFTSRARGETVKPVFAAQSASDPLYPESSLLPEPWNSVEWRDRRDGFQEGGPLWVEEARLPLGDQLAQSGVPPHRARSPSSIRP